MSTATYEISRDGQLQQEDSDPKQSIGYTQLQLHLQYKKKQKKKKNDATFLALKDCIAWGIYIFACYAQTFSPIENHWYKVTNFLLVRILRMGILNSEFYIWKINSKI